MNETDFIKMVYEMTQANAQHLATLNEEMGGIQKDVDLLMKFFWIVMGTSMATMVGVFWNLVLHKKNNKH